MGHLTTKDAYKSLEERINWFTQGAPSSDTLYKILQVLYTEKEARWVAKLPVRPFTLKRAARVWGTTEAKAEKLLDRLCEKALLVDSEYHGERQFVMPPPMAGFIEFALMRTRGDIDQKYLSELYYQYMNVEEDFVKDLFFATETRLGRVFVQEPVLVNDKTNHILDYERATHIVEEAKYIGLGTCYCRHKMYHAGHPCEINAPWEVCLTFDNVARSLAEHGEYARLISKEEAKEVLQLSYDSNLVQIGENVREHPAFICNCCGCCCEALQAARKFSPMQPVATTNYIPEVSLETSRLREMRPGLSRSRHCHGGEKESGWDGDEEASQDRQRDLPRLRSLRAELSGQSDRAAAPAGAGDHSGKQYASLRPSGH